MQISVIGSGAEHEDHAEEVGRLLAEAECTLVCGGLGEVMAAAARGAKSAGGTTIGILPGETSVAANEWIDHAVVTGVGRRGKYLAVGLDDGRTLVCHLRMTGWFHHVTELAERPHLRAVFGLTAGELRVSLSTTDALAAVTARYFAPFHQAAS